MQLDAATTSGSEDSREILGKEHTLLLLHFLVNFIYKAQMSLQNGSF